MVKYFVGQSLLRSSWDQVFAAFWQRYPNPYSKHVLTEDIVHREVTPDRKLLSRRLLTKTSRAPRWAERFLPANVAHSVYILEDSIVDPTNQTMTTFTWNINHARLMASVHRLWGRGEGQCPPGGGGGGGGAGGSRLPEGSGPSFQVVEERCVYRVNPENSGWTEIRREAWVSSSLFGVSRAVQEFGLARFKSNVTKTTKGFEYILAKLQGKSVPPPPPHQKFIGGRERVLFIVLLSSPKRSIQCCAHGKCSINTTQRKGRRRGRQRRAVSISPPSVRSRGRIY
uniref:PRELI domain containing 1 n=1 Tax=Ornithorhynchus anatinus TaxID=9258 RepID=A0A6I8PBM4_ORNAN